MKPKYMISASKMTHEAGGCSGYKMYLTKGTWSWTSDKEEARVYASRYAAEKMLAKIYRGDAFGSEHAKIEEIA